MKDDITFRIIRLLTLMPARSVSGVLGEQTASKRCFKVDANEAKKSLADSMNPSEAISSLVVHAVATIPSLEGKDLAVLYVVRRHVQTRFAYT